MLVLAWGLAAVFAALFVVISFELDKTKRRLQQRTDEVEVLLTGKRS